MNNLTKPNPTRMTLMVAYNTAIAPLTVLVMVMIVLLLTVGTGQLRAQFPGQEEAFPKRAQISSFAQVITQIQIEALQDMIMNDQDGTSPRIFIDPRFDMNASVILIEGKRELPVRLTFPARQELVKTDGTPGGTVMIDFEISWNTIEDQRASLSIIRFDEELQIGPEGTLYLWVGGMIDISDAREGTYMGNFFVEVEYL